MGFGWGAIHRSVQSLPSCPFSVFSNVRRSPLCPHKACMQLDFPPCHTLMLMHGPALRDYWVFPFGNKPHPPFSSALPAYLLRTVWSVFIYLFLYYMRGGGLAVSLVSTCGSRWVVIQSKHASTLPPPSLPCLLVKFVGRKMHSYLKINGKKCNYNDQKDHN